MASYHTRVHPPTRSPAPTPHPIPNTAPRTQSGFLYLPVTFLKELRHRELISILFLAVICIPFPKGVGVFSLCVGFGFWLHSTKRAKDKIFGELWD
ncbi:hypothetical protein OIU79_002178 [Salix purpurea]|uniref:Transmembrane protein n=1 Tax=Salix purpurea TaxID=77065 RepID=A0A9Q0US91_SALPP|nr:hypothetical protein OIU79_002178 [Salix purpurea]